MDRADVIRLASQAWPNPGIADDLAEGFSIYCELEDLERFAALVLDQVLQDVLQALNVVATHRGDTWGDGFNSGVVEAEKAVRGMKSDSGHSATAAAGASTAPLPEGERRGVQKE